MVKPITLLMGPETAMRDEAVRATEKELFADRSSLELNKHAYLAGSDSFNDALTQSQTAPFLAEKRLVILQEVENLEDAERKALVAHLKNLPSHAVWILSTSEPKAKNAFLTELTKIARVVPCQAPYKDADVLAWIRKKASEKGKPIDFDAAEALYQMTGKEMTQLESRVEQLALYAGERSQIRREDVEAVGGESIYEGSFTLFDAVTTGRFDAAYKSLKRLMENGAKAQELIGALSWRFERNVKIRELVERGYGQEEICAALNLNRFYAAGEIQQAKAFDSGMTRRSLDVLMECDRAIKRGLLEPEMALEKCLLGLNEVKTQRKA